MTFNVLQVYRRSCLHAFCYISTLNFPDCLNYFLVVLHFNTPEAEFKEFEPKYGFFHLQLY